MGISVLLMEKYICWSVCYLKFIFLIIRICNLFLKCDITPFDGDIKLLAW